jgi:hypothetical protein
VLWSKREGEKIQNFRATTIVCHIATYIHNFFCKDFPHMNCVKIFQRVMARKEFLEKRGINDGNLGMSYDCKKKLKVKLTP